MARLASCIQRAYTRSIKGAHFETIAVRIHPVATDHIARSLLRRDFQIDRTHVGGATIEDCHTAR